MENKLIKQFQVEELEQRLEMGKWTLSVTPSVSAEYKPGQPPTYKANIGASMSYVREF